MLAVVLALLVCLAIGFVMAEAADRAREADVEDDDE